MAADGLGKVLAMKVGRTTILGTGDFRFRQDWKSVPV